MSAGYQEVHNDPDVRPSASHTVPLTRGLRLDNRDPDEGIVRHREHAERQRRGPSLYENGRSIQSPDCSQDLGVGQQGIRSVPFVRVFLRDDFGCRDS